MMLRSIVWLFLRIALPVLATPELACAFEAPITPVVSAAAESSHLLKGGPGGLISIYATIAGASAAQAYLMVFNSLTAPADGAVTPQDCVAFGPIASTNGATATIASPLQPEWFTVGITAVISTGASCFSKTAANGFINARVQ